MHGSAHRAHASNRRVAERLHPAVAGLLVEREDDLRAMVKSPERPFVVLFGGAKVTDKFALIDRFLDIADALLIGERCASASSVPRGAHGRLAGRGGGRRSGPQGAGESESSDCRLLLPVELVFGDSFDAEAELRDQDGIEVSEGWIGLDIGPRTAETCAGRSKRPERSSGTGPIGAFEMAPRRAPLGGRGRRPAPAPNRWWVGRLGAALAEFGLDDEIDHMSTRGGGLAGAAGARSGWKEFDDA